MGMASEGWNCKREEEAKADVDRAYRDRVDAVVRMYRRAALREAGCSRSPSVQRIAPELENGGASRSGGKRQVVGSFRGPAVEWVGRAGQCLQSNAEGGAGS